MTCIVGVEYGGKVWIGADSSGVSNDHINIRADRKVFVNNGYIFGFAGSFRIGQILRYNFKPPVYTKDKDIEEFMVVDFIRDLKIVLEEHNKDHMKPYFLTGYMGNLFTIHEDFQVARNTYPYSAIGSGLEPAMGSLFSTYELNIPIDEKIRLALHSAQQFCSSVREPIYIECV